MGTKKGQVRKTARRAYEKKRQYPKRKSAEPMMDLTGTYRSDSYFEKVASMLKVTIKEK